jgi:DNA-binding transcriptional ArsR family regulator
MVKYQPAALDGTFAALADPTRRAILARLAHGSAPMRDIAEPFHMSWPAITKHVKVLERAGLVRREQDGREHRIHLSATRLQTAHAWIEDYRSFWEERFDALARYLDEPKHPGTRRRTRA